MSVEVKYVVRWRSKLTGKTGCGKPIDKGTAQAMVDKIKRKWPDFEHWLEEASDGEL